MEQALRGTSIICFKPYTLYQFCINAKQDCQESPFPNEVMLTYQYVCKVIVALYYYFRNIWRNSAKFAKITMLIDK